MSSAIFKQHLLRCFCSFLFTGTFAPSVLAQTFHLGLKAGVPTTEYFLTGFQLFPQSGGIQYSAATRRYTLGLSAEWRITHGLGIEVDALYKRTGYVHDETFFSSSSGVFGTTFFDVKGNSYDIPVLMKYRFFRSRRPYATGGFVFRHIGPVRARGVSTQSEPFPTRHTVTTQIDTSEPYDLRDRNFPGLTLGGGYEFGSGWLRLLPELRYTHWLGNIESAGDALRLNPHQLEFLLGFVFFRR
ncbi:MAG: PorT family protein [Acidobacteriia bacterium]|nr:PorT family protein [Terriglobia bacterium]